ncbi:MAG: hypothetical protein JXO22_10070, partial [Phycisphaerae bacterium]|nr:hypothetical protein [Phycisphaerae bacterium]
MRALPGLLILWMLAGGCGQAEHTVDPLFVFGHAGHDAGEFDYPRAAAASTNRYYIVDKSARIQCFDTRGQYLFEWQMPQQTAGKPVGLGVAPDGRVFVADTHYGRVLVFDADGKQLAEFGSFGDGPGQFRLPTDVAVDSQGFVYVAEYGGNDRINKFTAEFELLFSFGGPDQDAARLLRPQGIMIAPDDTLWVVDAGNHRVCHFDGDGDLLATFGGIGRDAGQLRFPYGIDRLSDGTLVVAEFGNNRVQRFRTDG